MEPYKMINRDLVKKNQQLKKLISNLSNEIIECKGQLMNELNRTRRLKDSLIAIISREQLTLERVKKIINGEKRVLFPMRMDLNMHFYDEEHQEISLSVMQASTSTDLNRELLIQETKEEAKKCQRSIQKMNKISGGEKSPHENILKEKKDFNSNLTSSTSRSVTTMTTTTTTTAFHDETRRRNSENNIKRESVYSLRSRRNENKENELIENDVVFQSPNLLKQQGSSSSSSRRRNKRFIKKNYAKETRIISGTSNGGGSSENSSLSSSPHVRSTKLRNMVL